MRLLLLCLFAAILVLTAGFGHSPAGAELLPMAPPQGAPTPTVSPLVLKTAAAQLSEFLAAPPPPIRLADCIPGAEFVRCHDRLLAMDFIYPAFFGDLVDTQLRAGGIEGVAYEYMFIGDIGAQAGGRSHVFAEPRGGMVTDQMGFGDRSGQQICAEFGYASCREIKPGVLLVVMAPEGQHLCPMGMSNSVIDAQVLINLPHHLAVNGFGFFTPLLSPEEEQGLLALLSPDNVNQECDAEALAAYDRDRLALVRALETGTAAPDIQDRYDAMLRLARSINGPYVSDDLYAPLRPRLGWQCSVTLPNGQAPPGEDPDAYFYGNGGFLWTRLWPGGIVLITDDSQVRADGAYMVDFPWWRMSPAALTIETQRPDPRFEAIIPAGYENQRFQPSTLVFPNAGCWQITARTGDEEMTIALEIKDVRGQ